MDENEPTSSPTTSAPSFSEAPIQQDRLPTQVRHDTLNAEIGSKLRTLTWETLQALQHQNPSKDVLLDFARIAQALQDPIALDNLRKLAEKRKEH